MCAEGGGGRFGILLCSRCWDASCANYIYYHLNSLHSCELWIGKRATFPLFFASLINIYSVLV